MAVVTMRFDLMVPDFAPVPARDYYVACLEMCDWAEQNDLGYVVFSEHHGLDNGWMPAPLTMAGVVTGRTTTLNVTAAAALVTLHDPVRIAEQLAVLDLASGGRVSIVAGIGYRPEEFTMAGVEKRRRGKILEENLQVMLKAWTGEPFEWKGRTVRATPRPFTQPHPMVMVGGSTEVACRRAARLGLPFFPADVDERFHDWYADEAARHGQEGGFVIQPRGSTFVFVTDDVDRTWGEIGPYLLHEAQLYDSFQSSDQTSAVHVPGVETVDDVRATGAYDVVTPDEAVALAEEAGPAGAFVLNPLSAGIPPEIGWRSLELTAAEVLPRL
ncbi:MAG: LLM class flavin-dependent oxidoreductase [Acidimicrobiia bacterium]